MSLIYKLPFIYPSTALSDGAETHLIEHILTLEQFKSSAVQRRLATYPFAMEAERDDLIMELMDYFWKVPSSTQLFSVFRDFDKVFTILDTKGHFIHTFEVYMLGCHLISQLLNKNGGKKFASNKNITKQKIYEAWLFASTAHDFGYPLQVADKLNLKFSKLYHKIHMKQLSIKFKAISRANKVDSEKELMTVRAYNRGKKRDESIDINNFILEGIKLSIRKAEDAEAIQQILIADNNHGYIGAMILCRTYIDYLSKANIWKYNPEKWRVNILRMVVAAIALHAIPRSNKDIIKKIRFNANPFAYLLLLIDNLQEWNRSLRPSKEWPSYNLVEIKTSSNNISLKYILTHEKWTMMMKKKVIKSLQEKITILKMLTKPKPSLNYEIKVSFTPNEGKSFPGITIYL